MPRCLKICNLDFGMGQFIEEFEVNGYKFLPTKNENKHKIRYSPNDLKRYHRNYIVTSKVNLPTKQQGSVIFRDEMIYSRKSKLLNDILLLISLLVRRNVVLYSWRSEPQFPAIPTKQLREICSDSKQLKGDMCVALKYLKNEDWQQKYKNGFHLKMSYYHSNILHFESRIIANFVIWELLYQLIFEEENSSKKRIISKILQNFWGNEFNVNVIEDKICKLLAILRNQLVHNGTLPISRNRRNAEAWMKQLSSTEIRHYLDFFEILTQIVILKTLGLDCENRINNFSSSLQEVLQTGRLTTEKWYSSNYYL